MKKKKVKYKPLTMDQRAFIKTKVVKLGSVLNVERVYNRDDLVSEFAKAFAERYYSTNKRRK